MFTLAGMHQLHTWTHASLDVLLDHLSTMPAEDLVTEVAGFGFPTLQAQAVHICNCEGFWVHLLQALPYKERTTQECAALADLRRIQKETGTFTVAYLDGLPERELNAIAELHHPAGIVLRHTPAHALHHALTHAFHHKGQMVAMCRLLGYPAADTDLI